MSLKYWDGAKWVYARNNPSTAISGPYIKAYDGTKFTQHLFRYWDGAKWVLQPIYINNILFDPNDSNAMTQIINDSTALNAMVNDQPIMSLVVDSPTALSIIWNNTNARQAMLKAHAARQALFNNPSQLKALTVTNSSPPDLISEDPLNEDTQAGILTKVEKYASSSNGVWTAVDISGGQYLVWIHFQTYNDYDWYIAHIGRYQNDVTQQTTNNSTAVDGKYHTAGNFNVTNGGLHIDFNDFKLNYDSSDYARAWYIQV